LHAKGKFFQVGTLVYTHRDLVWLFGWLLAGDFIFVLLSQLEPRVLPIMLKQLQASDKQIALIIGSIPALLTMVINPIVSYRSDRKRSSRGRRIPYLLWATPFASLFLALTPYAAEIGTALRMPSITFLGETWTPTLVALVCIVILFQCFQAVIGSIYFYLFRDTVPAVFMGRFLSLMRVFGALGTFVLNYWLLGIVEQHSRAIFLSVAVLNLVGFGAMCFYVREGEYPPLELPGAASSSAARSGLWHAVLVFVTESFSHPIYWWTYGARLLIYATVPISGFVIFFAHQELSMSFDLTGKALAVPAIAWLLFAYPAGQWIDRRGAVTVMAAGALACAILNIASFVGVLGAKSFLVASIGSGLAGWLVALAMIALAQEIFPAARMGQFSSANVLLQSLVVALVTTPCAGWLLDSLRGVHLILNLPWGVVEVGSYRFSYLLLAVLYSAALFCTIQARRCWHLHGGPQNYIAPLRLA
jgi:MFS family permease